MVIKHLELFAGMGGFRQALELFTTDFGIKSQSVGFSEIDYNATKTYKANFDTSKEVEMGDIVAFVNSPSKLKSLPKFDILTGGFPCQSFSMMGKQKGFKDLRGNVFFQIIDIIKEKKPKFILLENVKNLKTHNKGETFATILKFIKEAGYPYINSDIFNTSDFELAQTRNRVYIFATYKKLPDDFIFNAQIIKDAFKSIKNKTSVLKQKNVLDVLEKNVDKKFYLSEILKPTILSDGTKNFKSKSDINQMLARPLTATMVKMHRACQDNYFSSDFILNPSEYNKHQYSKAELAKKDIRKITPKEAFLFQGFNKEFFKNAEKAGISNHQLYKQAGNAISVNVVYAILYYLFKFKKLS
jgi:DNA (cytosine-5)-methyltransferase 1